MIRIREVDVEIMPPTDAEPLIREYELPDAAAAGEIGFAFFDDRGAAAHRRPLGVRGHRRCRSDVASAELVSGGD